MSEIEILEIIEIFDDEEALTEIWGDMYDYQHVSSEIQLKDDEFPKSKIGVNQPRIGVKEPRTRKAKRLTKASRAKYDKFQKKKGTRLYNKGRGISKS